MSFYLRPANGKISLQNFEASVVSRLDFLFKINQNAFDRVGMLDVFMKTAADSGCLIDGTLKDNISHFALRLLLSGTPETEEFLLNAETHLFQFRFSCFTEDEIYKLLKGVQKYILDCVNLGPSSYNPSDINHVLGILGCVKSSAITWRSLAHKYMNECNNNWFQVPFQSVTSLVARKEVGLCRGWALVRYHQLDTVLSHVFRASLKIGLKQARWMRQNALHDERLRRIERRLKCMFRTSVPVPLSSNNRIDISHDQVDQLQEVFPPCMRNLHTVLRRHHRLKHNDRIQYTLFLKEAGMSVHQALWFWQQEYLQSSSLSGHHHSWQDDEQRYLYNIRHLYGLEGARRNYRGHCCSSLQRRHLGQAEQGGCPFVHFDDLHLNQFLDDVGITEERQTEIVKLKLSEPNSACHLYMRSKQNSLTTTPNKSALTTLGSKHLNSDSKGDSYKTLESSVADIECEKIQIQQNRHRRVDSKNRGWTRQTTEGMASCEGRYPKQCEHVFSGHTHTGCKRKAFHVGNTFNTTERVSQHCSEYNTSLSTTNNQAHKLYKIEVDGLQNRSEDILKNQLLDDVNCTEKNEGSCDICFFQEGISAKKIKYPTTGLTCDTDFRSTEICNCSHVDKLTPSLYKSKTVPGMSAEPVDEAACLDPGICASQVQSNSQREKIKFARGSFEELNGIHIFKPVDFYSCFTELLQGMKQQGKGIHS